MRLTIFGATGRTGRYLVEQALAAGHDVTAFARNPGRLDLEHERLQVVQGDIHDRARVAQAIEGAGAVLSALGPTSNQPGIEVTRGVENILNAMREHGVRRLVVSAGAAVGDPHDEPKLFNRVIGLLLRLTARNVYEDMKCVVETVRASDLDWTIVRVPMLTDGPATGTVRTGWVGKGIGARLTRADLARYLLAQVDDRTFLRQAPAISN